MQPVFLNLMALVAERGGSVNCRFGGNTQDQAVVVDSLPDGESMQKFLDPSQSNRVRIQFIVHLTLNGFLRPYSDGHSNHLHDARNYIYAQQRFVPCRCQVVRW